MANLTELSQWESGIYQLETTDPVEAGAGGISNEQARLLANRTSWLYKFIPKNRGLISGVNVGSGSVGAAYAKSGDIVSATKTANLGVGDVIRIVLSNTMSSTNYKVIVSVESVGTLSDDNEIKQPIWKKVSENTFDFFIEELASVSQNLTIHFDVISLD